MIPELGCKWSWTTNDPQFGPQMIPSVNEEFMEFVPRVEISIFLSSFKRANEAFCLKYKEIATRTLWSSLVRLDQWGWDSAETALYNSVTWGGLGEHFTQILFQIFFIVIWTCYNAFRTCFNNSWLHLGCRQGFTRIGVKFDAVLKGNRPISIY